jgi:hypothetical protein
MLHDLQKHGNSTEVSNGQEYTIFFAMQLQIQQRDLPFGMWYYVYVGSNT